jgi:hypothetical protein
MDHISLCRSCRQRVRETRQLIQAAKNMPPALTTPADSWATRFRRRLFVPVAIGIAFAAGAALFFLLPRQPDKQRIADQAEIAALLSANKSYKAQYAELKQQVADQKSADDAKLKSARHDVDQIKQRLQAREQADKRKSRPGFDQSVEQLLASAKNNSPVAKTLDNGRGVPMGPTKVVLLTPCAEAVGGLPEFHWEPVPNATHYRLILSRKEDGKKLPGSGDLTETHYDLPASQLLPPGKYRWEVNAYGKNSSASTDEDQEADIAKGAAEFLVTAPANAQVRITLLNLILPLARYDKKEGRRQDATHEYRRVLEADPTNAEAKNALQH